MWYIKDISSTQCSTQWCTQCSTQWSTQWSTQCGLIWTTLVHNGSKWSIKLQSGPNWTTLDHFGPRWNTFTCLRIMFLHYGCQETSGLIGKKLVSMNSCKSVQMRIKKGGFKLCIVVLFGTLWSKVVQCGPWCSQVGLWQIMSLLFDCHERTESN